MLTVTLVEDAILETLRADTALASYVRLFTPIPSLDESRLKQIINVFPAVGAMFGRGELNYKLSGVHQADGLFSVLCFNQNLRSLTASVRGASGDKGVWDMIEDCRRVLVGGALVGVTVTDCLPVRSLLLRAAEPFAIAALETRISWRNI